WRPARIDDDAFDGTGWLWVLEHEVFFHDRVGRNVNRPAALGRSVLLGDDVELDLSGADLGQLVAPVGCGLVGYLRAALALRHGSHVGIGDRCTSFRQDASANSRAGVDLPDQTGDVAILDLDLRVLVARVNAFTIDADVVAAR